MKNKGDFVLEILNILKKRRDNPENSIFEKNWNNSVKTNDKEHESIDLFPESWMNCNL